MDVIIAGFALGLLVAPVIDATLLAYETKEDRAPVMLVPTLLISKDLHGVGLQGAF